MITAICILSGVAIFEAYLIIVLWLALKEERKYSDDIELIDVVAYEKNWRGIHGSD